MDGQVHEEEHHDERAVEEMSYTEASAELDEIVQFFEQRDVDVDQLVGRLVRATALVEELDKRLRRTRVQVEQLAPRLSAVLADEASRAEGPPEDEAPSAPARTRGAGGEGAARASDDSGAGEDAGTQETGPPDTGDGDGRHEALF